MSTNTNAQNGTAVKRTVSQYETGHLINVTHFEELIIFCNSLGERYNPANNLLTLQNLNAKFQEANDALSGYTTLRTKLNTSVDLRRLEFEDLKPTSTRAFNSFAVSGVDNLIVLNAKTHLNKLQGYSKKKSATSETDPAESDAKEVKKISTSQQSYDRQVDYFASLIDTFTQSGTYTPNESDLTLEALNTKLSKLKEATTNVLSDYTGFSNGLMLRNDVLYNPLTGLVNIALLVKKYIKSVFGASSPQFKQINSIEFRNLK